MDVPHAGGQPPAMHEKKPHGFIHAAFFVFGDWRRGKVWRRPAVAAQPFFASFFASLP